MTPRVIDLDGFDKRRYPKLLAAAFPFKLRGQVVNCKDADTVEVFLDQAFGDTTTVSVRVVNLSAAEKRSRNPIEKALGLAAWAEAQEILYPGRAVGLTSLKPLEPFGSSLGRTLGLIEVEQGDDIEDYAVLMLERKRELADEGIELGVWPSEDWPYAGMPPRKEDAQFGPLSTPEPDTAPIDRLKARVHYTATQDPEEARKQKILMDPQEREAMERTAAAQHAKEQGRTTPRFNEEETTRAHDLPTNPNRGNPMDHGGQRGVFRPDYPSGGPLRDSENRDSNPQPETRGDWREFGPGAGNDGGQVAEPQPEAEPVSLKTEPTRIINLAVVLVILIVQGAGIVLSDEETNLVRQSVEILVEIAVATGLLQYLRTRVWSEASHKDAKHLK